MKKLFIYIILNVLTYNEISSNFSSIQEYPYMDQYYPAENINETACQNLKCNASQMIPVQIKLLVHSFNEELNRFVQKKNISNAYKLHWDTFLSQIAQDKSGKCLPATYENGTKKYFMLDKKNFKNLTSLSESDFAFEVVIGERFKAAETDSALFISNMIADFTTLFFSSEDDLASRASNKLVGCGYVYLESDVKTSDRLLCIFGLMHSGKPSFTLLKGPSCSQCDTFYKTASNSTWGCDLLFSYLCTETNLPPEFIECGPYLPYCDTVYKHLTGVDESTDEIPVLVEEDLPEEWPCLPILIPLALLIIIFLGLAVYHFVTALKLRYTFNL